MKAAEQRGDRWREAWGVEQTEIDALATLRPAVLGRIVREALAPFYDETLDDRLREAERFAQAIAALNIRIAAATASADIELPPLVIPGPEIDEDDHGKAVGLLRVAVGRADRGPDRPQGLSERQRQRQRRRGLGS